MNQPAQELHLALLEAARIGREIRLIVVAEVNVKGFRLARKQDTSAN
jgi:hypothetical protein